MKRYTCGTYINGIHDNKYAIRDSTIDNIICVCNTSEDANMIIKAMNQFYRKKDK